MGPVNLEGGGGTLLPVLPESRIHARISPPPAGPENLAQQREGGGGGGGDLCTLLFPNIVGGGG